MAGDQSLRPFFVEERKVRMDPEKLDTCRKLAPNAIPASGNLKTFQKQIMEAAKRPPGRKDMIVVAPSTKDLGFISSIDHEVPLLMSTKILNKLYDKHGLSASEVRRSIANLRTSPLGFDSKHGHYIAIAKLNSRAPMFVALGDSLDNTSVAHHIAIASVYERENTEEYIINRWRRNGRFFKNDRTEAFIRDMDLPPDMAYGLSSRCIRKSCCREEIREDISKAIEADWKAGVALDRNDQLLVIARAADARLPEDLELALDEGWLDQKATHAMIASKIKERRKDHGNKSDPGVRALPDTDKAKGEKPEGDLSLSR